MTLRYDEGPLLVTKSGSVIVERVSNYVVCTKEHLLRFTFGLIQWWKNFFFFWNKLNRNGNIILVFRNFCKGSKLGMK